MQHINSTSNHVIHNYTYADATARNAATGFVAGDVGKVAKQTDTNAYYILTATTPTWQLIGSGTVSTAATYCLVGGQASVTGTGTTALDMSVGPTASNVVIPFAGFVVGISISCAVARTAGTLQAQYTKNGVADSTNVATIDGTNTLRHYNAFGTPVAVAAGDYIGLQVVGSSFTPNTTADPTVCVWLSRT